MRHPPGLAAAILCLGLAACGGDGSMPVAPRLDPPTPRGAGAGGLVVTSAADAGPGSLRDALAVASTNAAIGAIRIARGLGPIAIASGLVFAGRQALWLDGDGAVIDGARCGCTALTFTGGGDVSVRRLEIRDAPGTGLAVLVPAHATGIVSVDLRELLIDGNGLHGVLIEDQVHDSPAGVRLDMSDSRVTRNGFVGASDFDGVRVNEGGDGHLLARFDRVEATANGADGVELDEAGPGDVRFSVFDSRFDFNGPHDPADLDDGFDVDEAGAGSVIAQLVASSASDNFDEGWDFDEAGEGGIEVTAVQIDGSRNGDEGIKLSEEDGGSIVASFERASATGNGDDGMQLEEAGAGRLTARIVRAVLTGNARRGLDVSQAGPGTGEAKLLSSALTGNASGGHTASGVALTVRP